MKNKVLLVTGGSGEIGAATAVKASELHYKVCISFLNNRAGAEKVVSIINDAGGHSIAMRADTSSEDDVRALFDFCEEELGPITHLP